MAERATDGDADILRFRRALEGLLGVPATEGNQVEILRNGDETFAAMLECISGADRTVDFMAFVYAEGDAADQFAEALCERARAGVRVRVLLDKLGSREMNDEVMECLLEAGVHFQWFREPTRMKLKQSDQRTHRKILVCDELVGFTGGLNVGGRWQGDANDEEEWRDTHVRIVGPAVDGLRASFVENWAETGEDLFGDADQFPVHSTDGDVTVQVVRSAAGMQWSDTGTLFATFIALARQRLRIVTPYFVPNGFFTGGLCEAARRGVQVQVLMPGQHMDHPIVRLAGENDYESLLEAGVEIWRYEKTMIHAKVLTVDGAAAYVGSANFDHRSVTLNDEAGVVLFDRGLVGELDADFDTDLQHSERIEPGEWAERGPAQKVVEKVTGIFDNRL